MQGCPGRLARDHFSLLQSDSIDPNNSNLIFGLTNDRVSKALGCAASLSTEEWGAFSTHEMMINLEKV